VPPSPSPFVIYSDRLRFEHFERVLQTDRPPVRQTVSTRRDRRGYESTGIPSASVDRRVDRAACGDRRASTGERPWLAALAGVPSAKRRGRRDDLSGQLVRERERERERQREFVVVDQQEPMITTTIFTLCALLTATGQIVVVRRGLCNGTVSVRPSVRPSVPSSDRCSCVRRVAAVGPAGGPAKV